MTGTRHTIRAALWWLALCGCVACSRGSAGPPPPAAAVPDTAAATADTAMAVATAKPTLTYLERQGQRVFTHYCAICHGAGGTGDGFNAWNLDPRPRDLTDPAYQKAVSDAGLRQVIAQGGLAVNQSNLMPGWGKTLTADRLDAVTAYVRALGARRPAPAGPVDAE